MLRNLLLCIVFLPLLGQAKQIDICPTCTQSSIKKAIAAADSGDILNVKAGTYFENEIEISTPLTLQGEGLVVIDGQKKGSILQVTANYVRLSNLTIRNVGMSHTTDYAAIHFHKADHYFIDNCRLEGVFFGMLIEKSNFGTIQYNTISSGANTETSAGNGIHLWQCHHVFIDHNHVSKLRDGIYFEFVSESVVSNNVSYKNHRYGLHFMFSNHDSYKDNVFQENGAGVAVMFSKFISMTCNRFYKNWGTASYGLLLKEIYDATISHNEFIENTIAINVEGSTRIDYKNNLLKSNGWAVKIAGACYANRFIANNFRSNAFDISYNSQMNDNVFNGNFWSDYTGYDLDKDGIGDIPYRPVKLFSYIVNRTPESIVLLRSLFVDILNFSEKVSPVFTPDDLVDNAPSMKEIR